MTDAAFRDHIAALKAASHGPDIAVALGLRGRGKRFFCPLCQADGGKTPDLSIFDLGFKCYKCGQTGDIIDLVVLAGRMSKSDAIRYLEGRTGLKGSRGGLNRGQVVNRPPIASNALKKAIKSEDGADHADLYDAFLGQVCQPVFGTPGAAYLEGRGIATAVADRYAVRYCPDLNGLWSLADRSVIKAAGLSSLYVFQKAGLPVLVFPYIRKGRTVFIKTRCLLSKDDADRREVPRFLNTGGKVPCLWNHDAVADAGQVIICEGEIDALSAIMAGLVGVGLPGWSHWKDVWTRDFIGKDVRLVMDADAAGQKGVADIARRFMKAGLPCPLEWKLAGGTDLNDAWRYFMKDGKTERMKS